MITGSTLVVLLVVALLLWLIFYVIPLRQDVRNILGVIVAVALVIYVLVLLGVVRL